MQAAEILEKTAVARAAPAHQRMRGVAEVAMARRRGATRLTGLAQSGAAKAMLPRVHGADPEVVLLNTAGGLTGGDNLRYALSLGDGARAVATTQTAERAYCSLPELPPARLDVEITVGAGGHLSWLPQETILFDGAALHRRTRIDLAEGASCLACESVVLGRAAMGETVARLDFRDWREIRRAGAPVYLDPFAFGQGNLAKRDGVATLGGARAMASVVFVGEDAADRLEPLRGLIDSAPGDVEAAASAWQGRMVLRALATDAQPLRRLLSAVLAQLGGGLPRVWQM